MKGLCLHSASCVLGSLCEGFVSVHSASCVLVSSLCEGFVSVHSASCVLGSLAHCVPVPGIRLGLVLGLQ